MMADRISKNAKKYVTATLIAGMIASSGGTLAYADNGFDDSNYRGVGYISVVGEVGENGNGGVISTGKGDAGGKSYGLSQFTSKGGGASANSFVSWLKKSYPELGRNFDGVSKAGTSTFDNAWKASYKQNPDLFEKAQMEYTYKIYVKDALKNGKEKFGIDLGRSRALLELVYSTSVQFGSDGTIEILSNAGIDSSMSDLEIIERATDEKLKSVGTYKFEQCSKKVQSGVKDRFGREEKELIDINNGEVDNLEGEMASNSKTLDEILDGGNQVANNSSSQISSDEIVKAAKSYLNQGTTYKMGGKNTDKLDCSGYISLVYQDLGLDIDEMMTNAGKFRNDSKSITREELKEGDLVFWHDLSGKKHAKVFHIGIYVGNDTVIDCSIDHNGVGTRKLSSLQDKEGDRYFTFGRYEDLGNDNSSSSATLDEILGSSATLDEILEGVEGNLSASKQEPTLDDILDGVEDNTDTSNQEPTLDDILDGIEDNTDTSNQEPTLDDMLDGVEDNTDTSNQESVLDDVLDGAVDNNENEVENKEDNSSEGNADTSNQEPTLDDMLDGAVDNNEDNNSNELEAPEDSSNEEEKVEDTKEPIVNEDKVEDTKEPIVNEDKVEDTKEPTVEEEKVEGNTSNDNQAQGDSLEESDTLDNILSETENKNNDASEKVEDNSESNDDVKSDLNNEEVLENEKASELTDEKTQVIASLEEKIENNKFARLFKTTKMIMDSKMA